MLSTFPSSSSAKEGTRAICPAHPDMRATLILTGAAMTSQGSLGEADMRDVVPTQAVELDFG